MIKNFSDHAANERTFLAWVRTAIAVMAFGFIVEKFDLFLEIAAPSLVGRTLLPPGQRLGNIAGLVLIGMGTLMVAISAVRFLVTERRIDSEDVHRGAGSRFDSARAAARHARLLSRDLSLARTGRHAVTPPGPFPEPGMEKGR
jgi:putative membrane protein